MPRSPAPGLEVAAVSRDEVIVDARAVAAGLGLDVPRFRELMRSGLIASLCERGTGEDAGKYRVTFYYERRRIRLVTDSSGNVLQTS